MATFRQLCLDSGADSVWPGRAGTVPGPWHGKCPASILGEGRSQEARWYRAGAVSFVVPADRAVQGHLCSDMPTSPILGPPHTVVFYSAKSGGWSTGFSDLICREVCVLMLCDFMEKMAWIGLGECKVTVR